LFPLRDNIPSRRFPFVNYLIIIANVFIFVKEMQLAQTGGLEKFIFSHGLIPARFMQDPLLHLTDIFTSMFLHGGWAHVIGNMWFLYIFGDNVEDNLGHIRYFFYYLLMGVGAALTQVFAGPQSQLPMVGASGAIAGILGSYCVLYPTARVETFFVLVIFVRVVEIPAFFFLGFWFLVQMLNGVGSLTSSLRGDMGGVAWWAHAGGFISGFVGILLFRRPRSRLLG
jgi:membrane associated rhomboid family serine protease